MDNKLMFGILGLVTGVALIANNVNNDYNNYESDSDNENVDECFSNPNVKNSQENFCNRFSSSVPSNYGNSDNNRTIPLITDNNNASPLEFGTMIDDSQTIENFSQPSYNTLNSGYNVISQDNLNNDGTSLPVSDMTAAENEKLIYDRSIGSVGFTSTKIGRRNAVGDLVRGDIPIIPDFNPSFQVSARPQDQLTVGAMQVSNGISSSSTSTTGAARALGKERKPQTLQSLKAQQDNTNRQFSLGGGGGAPSEIDIHDLIAAGQNSQKQWALQSGVNTGNDNTFSEVFYR